jgi:hypothetical protein
LTIQFSLVALRAAGNNLHIWAFKTLMQRPKEAQMKLGFLELV